MKKAGAPAIKVRVESSAVDGALGSASAARAAPARKRAREPDEFDAAPAVSSRAAVDDDDEYDLPPEVTFREGGSSGAAAGPRAAADAAAAAMGSASAIGIGAIVPYSGGATGGPGGGLFSGAPARPIAITKHGVRQFVETSHGVRLFLQNCVASTDLRCSPDLAHIATHARNAEYNPQRFSAVILRIREPKATALVFQSGKMVLTGSKNEEDALLASRTVAKIIMKLGFSCSIAAFKIQNIVATGDCGFPIRLEGLADEECKFSSYEPELFPGLIYRMEMPKVVILVFVSGKVVVTGAKSRSALLDGMDKLYPLLFKFRKVPAG